MTSVDELANKLKDVFEAGEAPVGFVWDSEELPVSVDDPSLEEPSMVMEAYSEIESIRVSFGYGQLYDIFVARVK